MGIQHALGHDGVNMIVQIVNCSSVMAGGVAKDIADIYPIVKVEYTRLANQLQSNALGVAQVIEVEVPNKSDGHYYVANLFAIDKPNYRWYEQRHTGIERVLSYPALCTSLSSLSSYMRLHSSMKRSDFTLMIPTGMGCLRAGGDWDIVKEHIDFHLKDVNVLYYK